MGAFIAIAWRNIRRNRRRSGLTIFIIGVGLAALVISNALYDGFHEKMVDNAVGIFMGHLQVHARGFQDNPTVEKYFTPGPESPGRHPGVHAVARRVRFQALASTASASQAVLVVGIDPPAEKRVTILENAIIGGRYLAGERNECLAGEQLCRNLRIALGEKVVLMSQAADGAIAADAFRITGVCRTGNPEIDRSFVWIPLATAQEMLNYGDGISGYVVLAEGDRYVPGVRRALEGEFGRESFEVLTWREMAPDIVQVVELNVAMQTVLLIIISVIVAMAIMNTMLMAVQERYAELGVMSAIGTKPRQIVGMIAMESFFLSVLGFAAGAVLTSGGFVYLSHHGVNLASFSEGIARLVGLNTTVYPVLKTSRVLAASIAVTGCSTAVSLIPALRAAHMDVVRAIRHI